MTNAPLPVGCESHDRLDEIEVTSAMIEAGVYAAREHRLGLPLNDLVHAIYVAMRTEELNTKRSCLLNEGSKVIHK
jgi:hypothetical protein